MGSQYYNPRAREMFSSARPLAAVPPTGGYPSLPQQQQQHQQQHNHQMQSNPSALVTAEKGHEIASMNGCQPSMQNPSTAFHADALAWQSSPQPPTATAIGTGGFASWAGYSNGFPSEVGHASNGLRMGVEGTSGVVGVNYPEPSGQSTFPTTPEMHPCVPVTGDFWCGWEGCDYRGRFSRKSCLWRHIQDKHINPDMYPCPYCRRSFGRKDKLTSHTRSVHYKNEQAWRSF